ncbi:MAG: DUF2892 domain-containing protein [Steroidobacteraceae bacterium]
MLIDRVVFAISGALILVCLALAYLYSSTWLIVAAIVGLNMLQAGFTGLCPIAMTLKKLGMKSGSAFT